MTLDFIQNMDCANCHEPPKPPYQLMDYNNVRLCPACFDKEVLHKERKELDHE